MSNKPLKVSEQKKNHEKMKKKKKVIESLEKVPLFMLIACEGDKTEPNYFSGFVDSINLKYSKMVRGKIIKCIGTGRNTLSLLEYAKDYAAKQFDKAEIVWLVYDKDSFPSGNFNSTYENDLKSFDGRTFKCAWSNECFELWLLLHFVYPGSKCYNRDKYIIKLKNYIFNYQKNMPNIYNLVKDNTKKAIERAAMLHENNKYNKPSDSMHVTLVYLLVKELQSYL